MRLFVQFPRGNQCLKIGLKGAVFLSLVWSLMLGNSGASSEKML